ncbi:sulfate transporter subunit : Sulfate-binding protein OS=Enterobacter cloacae S611 GN=sbp PE=4 SV=1: SBP_bac_11 [Tuwongella immobilis]|uniref:Sulfate ABC transporter substrate-binding protein n=2 Tax=Tuwongella immobilis TaxID=692036 RepID=A0A6C2YQ93_9BACT|nr:sulfate ABC transporter substrate-binding protein [Tuwongella immobilis]VIP03185.1 sulfate transporter subunit : Sulfate-binding protein OS=Enterobacter cloacae S611 GN=sbp PE=4 SV=1: SBP_bac_11 [Tuwongella immobilis]VTS03642.1 sulfate transporter subunit : Sulfate-binding protein OS=Enterobacter cloacae S611 GN=sbp PE=4 SV=1: SBP_bac_11 [Tuwongella immobilis]
MRSHHGVTIGAMLILLLLSGCQRDQTIELLNVSYDPTRELYRKLHRMFAEQYRAETGKDVRIRRSHGGSSSQASAVMNGLHADVVTLAVRPDIDAIAKTGRIRSDWLTSQPNRSLPYTSTIVFVVRRGNPKQIHDWDDLVKPGVQVIPANPKTGGGARLNFLAAYGAFRKQGNSEAEALEKLGVLYRNAPVLDGGARSATITFVRKNIGDVQLTWENEAELEKIELGDAIEIIRPKVSILAEPHVALVDQNVDEKGTREITQAFLQFLYSETAQEVIAQEFYRPTNPTIAEKYRDRFPPMELLRVDDVVPGGWDAAQKRFFASGGIFDQIYRK